MSKKPRPQCQCEWCDHEWQAVHPCAERLECPRCGKFTPSTHSEQHNEWLRNSLKETP